MALAFLILWCAGLAAAAPPPGVAASPGAAPPERESKDTNGDGRPDQWITRVDGKVVTFERDRKGDGTVDLWATYTYPAEGPARAQIAVDRNGDGVKDYWRIAAGTRPVREWGDRNFDQQTDIWVFYADDGHKTWAVLDKNFDGRPDAWFFYGGSTPGAMGLGGIERPSAGEMDQDFDGKPDKTVGTLPATRPSLDTP